MRACRGRVARRHLHTYTDPVLTGSADYHNNPPRRDVPTKYDLCSRLTSCSNTLSPHLGRQTHTQVVKYGHEPNLFIACALVGMYSGFGAVCDARKVFDTSQNRDEVIWTAMMRGLAHNGFGREAILLFKNMLGLDVRPNCVTYVCALSACTLLGCTFELATLLHAHVVKLGFGVNCFLTCALVDCYSKCGRVDLARLLFLAATERDNVLVNSMISGYSQNGCGVEALRFFIEMRNGYFSPTDHTLPSILNACGSLSLLEQGTQVHSLIIKMGTESNMFSVSTLIDMYSKCSATDKARQVFNEAINKNSVAWTSMVTGYAYSGQGIDALELFDRMIAAGFTPDHICFTSVLVACNHTGLFDKGIEYFNKMRDYRLQPELDQYACLVDLYARNGKLRKAMEIIETMPCRANAVILSSFLGSCKVYGEVELGKEAAHRLFEMEPNNAAHYLTLASIYLQAGLPSEAARIRKLMNQKAIKMTRGRSWL
uniref:Pentatricopeptide repeat-containing protein n=1 Tax=Kalanchoe fedtschenkoi TaxID=63787 RepID=A0A7N0VMH7_KALFE